MDRKEILARLRTSVYELDRLKNQVYEDNILLISPFAEALAKKRDHAGSVAMFKAHLQVEENTLDFELYGDYFRSKNPRNSKSKNSFVQINFFDRDGCPEDFYFVATDHLVAGEFSEGDLVSHGEYTQLRIAEEEERKELKEYERLKEKYEDKKS